MKQKTLIGLRIKELRVRKKLSQEEVSERAETSANYWSRMERGTENPTLEMLIKIADALNVEMQEIFDFSHAVNSKSLKVMLRKLTDDIDDTEQLKTVVRVVNALIK